MQIRQALILAGGLGTRFRAVREDLPKPIAPVGGRGLLEWQLQFLAAAGITRAVLCLGHRADEIMRYLNTHPVAGVEIQCRWEPHPLGTAGAIRFGYDALDSGDFLVVNGDTLVCDLDYAALAARHHACTAAATLTLAPAAPNAASGGVGFDPEQGLVTGFWEKNVAARARWSNAGVYVFSPRVLTHLPAEGSLEYDSFPALLVAGETVAGFVHSGFVGDLGTVAGYRRVAAYVQSDGAIACRR